MTRQFLLGAGEIEALLEARAARPGALSQLPDASKRGLRVVHPGRRSPAAQDDDDTPNVGAADSPPEIWLYGNIGGWGIYAQDVRWALEQVGDAPAVTVRIHSRGGSVMEGAAIYTILQQSRKRIHIQIDGVALSDGCNISMVGDSIAISPRGFMMFHEAWDCVCGTADELDRTASLLRKINPSIASLYEDRLAASRAEILRLMKDESWYNAEEAVAAGLADSILSKPSLPDDTEPLEDLGQAATRPPRAALELFTRKAPAARSAASPLATRVADHLARKKTAPGPTGGVSTDMMRALERALGGLSP